MSLSELIELHLGSSDIEQVYAGVCSGCLQCQTDYGLTQRELETDPPEPEGFVSSAGCDSCEVMVQQMLYDAHGIDSDGDIVHLSICEECVMFHTYGS